MSRYSRKFFEKMVAKAVDGLPKGIKARLKNVAICVEDRPTRTHLKAAGTRRSDLLLGLFEGIPEIEWGKGFGNVLPDKITIFQENIEEIAPTQREIEQEIRSTLRHEIAHHFGWTDQDLKYLRP